jgi:hypothetical protein
LHGLYERALYGTSGREISHTLAGRSESKPRLADCFGVVMVGLFKRKLRIGQPASRLDDVEAVLVTPLLTLPIGTGGTHAAPRVFRAASGTEQEPTAVREALDGARKCPSLLLSFAE